MLHYLVKHLRPDIANVIHELSKMLLKLHHMIKYVLDTRNFGLKWEPLGKKKEPWKIVCFCNSNYTGDPGSRRSISGFRLYVVGVLVSWQSEVQRSIELFSLEAEWIMTMIQLVRSIKISIQLPVMLRVDSVGAIFMASNITTKPEYVKFR